MASSTVHSCSESRLALSKTFLRRTMQQSRASVQCRGVSTQLLPRAGRSPPFATAAPGQRHTPARQSWQFTVAARRNVEYDDDGDWDDPGQSSLVPGLLSGILGAVGTITDFVASNLPAGVSRGVVDLSVKASLALLVLSFARSVLSLVTTIGTIIFGLWIASKVLGGGDGKSGFDFDFTQRGSSPARQRGGRPRQPQQQRPPLALPGGSDEDLAEVWFEGREDRVPRRPRPR